MDSLLHILSSLCLLTGSFLILTGAVGVLRLPDFYTRLHAAGVTDTLGTWLVLLGLMLISGWSLITVKLVLILLFLFFTSPTASHALAKAARHGNLQPVTHESTEKPPSNS